MADLNGAFEGPIEPGFSNIIFVIPAVCVVGLAVFFVYKLFKCLSERQIKREEKKKIKQMKKKK
ncbi:uncharacterized protein LOC117603343 isoform X3 [Osmia lignaria lignaria]|uniref:uncharacterized protein LOC117603343 isoform X3 n=1 Tax=Osmia lignaria lignaria TaxID=1437193 RepID=UPI00147974F3|nr:uncharacterized protein LOC117603343 isoform X3 [Osmia lignaria]